MITGLSERNEGGATVDVKIVVVADFVVGVVVIGWTKFYSSLSDYEIGLTVVVIEGDEETKILSKQYAGIRCFKHPQNVQY